MGKQFSIACAIVVFILATLFSCSEKVDCATQNIQLENAKDSINYAYGLLWGNSTRDNYFDNSNDEEKIEDFVNGFNRASKSGAKNAHMYLLGIDIAKNIQQKEKDGVFQGSSFKTNKELMHQGVVNAVLNQKRGIDHKEAVMFYQQLIENTDLPEALNPSTNLDQTVPPIKK
jgi:hypothetical protein